MLINRSTQQQGDISKPVFYFLLLISFISLAGCAPDVSFESATGSGDANEIRLSLKVEKDRLADNNRPSAQLFNKFDLSVRYPVEITTDSNNPDQFHLSSNVPEAGTYRLNIEVPYKLNFLGIPFGTSNKTFVQDFVIHEQLPEACFNFNDKQKDVMGWKSSHVYQANKEAPASSTTCPGLFFVNTSWPNPLTQTKSTESSGGSLFIPVSSECFPRSSNKLSEQPEWMFSVTSPDLSSDSNWQGLQAINFRIAGKDMSFTVSPEVYFKIGEKISSTYEQSSEHAKYKIQSNVWQIIDYPLELPAGAIITHIELHLSGVPEQTVGEGVNSIFIDGICPAQAPTKKAATE